MTAFFNRPDIEAAIPIDSDVRAEFSELRKSIERMTAEFDALAESVKTSEKFTLLDLGSVGGTEEDIKAFVDELDRRGCKSFVHGFKVIAWGEAFEKAMERETMKPIPIAPLPKDPEIEKRIWMWQFSFWQ